MNKYLDYYWTFSLNHSGNSQLIRYKNILCGWKPIVVFQNGFKKIDIVSKDVITGSKIEKEYHDWQQSEKELIYIIEKFTEIGDTILEPFAGGGTTIVAAAKLKRKVIACEIDEKSYNISKVRIKNSL
jgi:site-specific DNA-methyltransferase (adenine-specific)